MLNFTYKFIVHTPKYYCRERTVKVNRHRNTNMEKQIIEHFQDRLRKGEYLVTAKLTLPPKWSIGKLLDVGCGATPRYSIGKKEIFGIDITPQMAKSFQKVCSQSCIVIADARNLPFKKATFDVVVANTLLHHIVGNTPQKCKINITRTLCQITYVLKERGVLIIKELLVSHKFLSLIIFYGCFFCAKLNLNINKLDIHSKVIVFFLCQSDYEKLFKKYRLRILQTEIDDWKILGKFKIGMKTQFLLTHSNFIDSYENWLEHSQNKKLK